MFLLPKVTYSVAKNWNPRYLVRLLLAKETYA